MSSDVCLRIYASSVIALAKKTFVSLSIAYSEGNGSLIELDNLSSRWLYSQTYRKLCHKN